MRIIPLGDIATVELSNIDKKSKDGESDVILCNFVDVYRNWQITKETAKTFMHATANTNQIAKFAIRKGQVAITKDSETRDDIGVATYIAEDIDDAVLGYHCALITPNENILRGEYLNIIMHSPYTQKYFELNASGSGQRYTLTKDIIEAFPVPVPDMDVQLFFGKLLSDIDTKIALNNSICADLEAMAKQIYDYWFVQFDFPDANGRPYKSSGGKMVWNEELKREIPEGWDVKPLGELCMCLLGGTPSRDRDEYWDGDINWINSGKVNEFRISECSEKITQEGLDNSSTYLLPRNTVVLAITGATLGQVSILNIDSCANQSVVGILESNTMHTEYIYPHVLDSLKLLLNQQTGAAQPHVNKNDIQSLPFIVPDIDVLNVYYKNVASAYLNIMNIQKENCELSELRDFLLPMLMNGQIKVEG